MHYENAKKFEEKLWFILAHFSGKHLIRYICDSFSLFGFFSALCDLPSEENFLQF